MVFSFGELLSKSWSALAVEGWPRLTRHVRRYLRVVVSVKGGGKSSRLVAVPRVVEFWRAPRPLLALWRAEPLL